METFIVIAIVLILLGLFFLPSIVAQYRRHPQMNTILVINIFLGWTFIGWVVALAWAMSNHKPSDEKIR